jgi:hypothetical protein
MPAHDPTVRAISAKIGITSRHHPEADISELRSLTFSATPT